ncbi:FAD-binding protein [Asaia siamensis]
MNKEGLHHHQSDILVIGGGLSGCWAALTAARAGARVLLLEKGYCGTSGVAAPAGPGHWWVPPLPGAREDAVKARLDKAQGLGEATWMHRIMARTWQTLPDIGRHYQYEPDDNGRIRLNALRGPEYLRALRTYCLAVGVQILDHSPVLGLLRDKAGRVAGAYGVHFQGALGPYRAQAGAIILATGGCAFQSRLLGAANNTGDGHLMAAEAGAQFSGMEFSSIFSVVPHNTTMSRAMIYSFARYLDEAGQEIAPDAEGQSFLGVARALSQGRVLCDLSAAPETVRAQLPLISPNVMLPFRRQGIDPFRERFPIDLVGEGTIRGVGGIRLRGEHWQTGVPGLYATGDVASRESVTGPISGGGAVNAAWALSSGCLAAEAALAEGHVSTGELEHFTGHEACSNGQNGSDSREKTIRKQIQAVMLDAPSQLSRNAGSLRAATSELENCHDSLTHSAPEGSWRQRQQRRETQSLLAVARWCTASALERTETLGMHRREDAIAKASDIPAYHVISSELEHVQSRREAAHT